MMESMTEDHKGIFVESMRRNDVFLFFNQVGEAREARESEQKIGTGREIKCRPLSFHPRNTQPNILCPTNVRPGEECAHLELTTLSWLSFKEIIIVTTEFVFSEPSTEIDNNQRTNSYHNEQLVSETSLSSDCEMKAEAASVNPTKISTNTDSQSHNSRKRKMSEFSCNPGMQKHELFLLLLLTSALLYLKGRSDC